MHSAAQRSSFAVCRAAKLCCLPGAFAYLIRLADKLYTLHSSAAAAECERAMMTMTLFYVMMSFTVIAGLVYCARRRTAIR